ncbi:hypothetical protein CDAR_478331 [Caerostris darwini]|uniref:Uncharacterized protein n=1 Tax=Caerostris darwini TaxID=1538125 RepID=A0AAV4RKS7_9ARAC|nr:hypothetical protein CDAR_478331 [Caerostris darwini]
MFSSLRSRAKCPKHGGILMMRIRRCRGWRREDERTTFTLDYDKYLHGDPNDVEELPSFSQKLQFPLPGSYVMPQIPLQHHYGLHLNVRRNPNNLFYLLPAKPVICLVAKITVPFTFIVCNATNTSSTSLGSPSKLCCPLPFPTTSTTSADSHHQTSVMLRALGPASKAAEHSSRERSFGPSSVLISVLPCRTVIKGKMRPDVSSGCVDEPVERTPANVFVMSG